MLLKILDVQGGAVLERKFSDVAPLLVLKEVYPSVNLKRNLKLNFLS